MILSDFKIRRVKDLESAIQGCVDITKPVIVYYKSEGGYGWKASLFYKAKFLRVHTENPSVIPSHAIRGVLGSAYYEYIYD